MEDLMPPWVRGPGSGNSSQKERLLEYSHLRSRPVNPEMGSNDLEVFQDVPPLLMSRHFSRPSAPRAHLYIGVIFRPWCVLTQLIIKQLGGR